VVFLKFDILLLLSSSFSTTRGQQECWGYVLLKREINCWSLLQIVEFNSTSQSMRVAIIIAVKASIELDEPAAVVVVVVAVVVVVGFDVVVVVVVVVVSNDGAVLPVTVTTASAVFVCASVAIPAWMFETRSFDRTTFTILAISDGVEGVTSTLIVPAESCRRPELAEKVSSI